MRRFLPISLFLLAAAGGCARNSPTDESRPKPKAPPSPIRLLVVDDSALAKSVGRLKAEWQARTGGALEIKEVPAAELRTAELLGGDAVIYPSHQLGTLAERDLIVPVPEEILKSPALDWPDVLELIQVAESTWGQRVFAIPFGSPLLTCYYRADLLERAGREPPKTWTEYQELVEYFSQRENLGDAVAHDAPWFGTVEPLGPGWAGRVLLARAAAYAKHRDNYSTLFRIDSMEPLIDTPPFVRALEELVAAARHSPPDSISFDPSAARRHFLAGHSALALSWPTAARDSVAIATDASVSVGFAELPGADRVYSQDSRKWEQRGRDESGRVSLLAIDGRLGSATRESGRAEAAWELLAWLSGPKWGARVSSASPATTMFRHSQLKAPPDWLDPGISLTAARQYSDSLKAGLSRQAWVFALRIPGQEEYLSALDRAVQSAVSSQQTASIALQQAATAWSEVSNRRGVDAQRRAYRASLGLEL